MRTRNEIIDDIVAAHRAETEIEAANSVVSADEKEYEDIIRPTVKGKLASLGPDEKVQTCEDFGHLGIACCDSCHSCYAHYELDLIDLECGGRAWICCAVGRGLNPVRQRELVNSPEYREIEKLLGGGTHPSEKHT